MNNSNDYTTVISKKRPRIKLFFTTQDWNIHHNVNVANTLNENVSFESDRFGNTIVNKLKINYKTETFLNFNKLLNLNDTNNQRSTTPTTNNNYGILRTTKNQFVSSSRNYDNNLNNNDKTIDNTLITTLHNEKLDKIYKTMFPDGQESKINKIEQNDRYLFNRLLTDSKFANFVNSNISTVSPQTYKKLKLDKDQFNNLEYIVINGKEIKTLYIAPFSQSINRQKIVHICEFCLQYYSSRYQFFRHRCKCHYRRLGKPPGDEIYRDENISVFEVDGRENKSFCKNLCLLSMLFLKSKTLYYEVESFIFYVLYRNNNEFIGYFSKEKLNNTDYNLSCILTLPTFRRSGFGFFLMEFSYLLSKREFKLGTPEKPFSDLGLITYKNFWKIKTAETLIKLYEANMKFVTLDELSNLTGMIPTDIIFGLEELQVLYSREDKNRITKEYSIFIDNWDRIKKIYNDWEMKGYQRVKPENLLWKPMIFGPSCGVNAINTNLVDTVTDTINNDIFKKHMGLLVNFMSDDINDGKDIEVATFEKILGSNVDRLKKISDDGNTSRWKLCYHEPTLTNLSQSSINGNKAKNNRDKSSKSNKSNKKPKTSNDNIYMNENRTKGKNNVFQNEFNSMSDSSVVLQNNNGSDKNKDKEDIVIIEEEKAINDGIDSIDDLEEHIIGEASNDDEEYTENFNGSLNEDDDDEDSILDNEINEDKQGGIVDDDEDEDEDIEIELNDDDDDDGDDEDDEDD